MPEPDPLALLQEQWQQMDLPSGVRALENEDALTQKSVDWMTQAWSQIEIPEVSLAQRKRALPFRVFSFAAAAALLISAVFLWMAKQTLAEDIVIPNLVVSAPRTMPTPPSPTPLAPPKLISHNAHHVQVLAGKVRLTMLRDSGISPESNQTDS